MKTGPGVLAMVASLIPMSHVVAWSPSLHEYLAAHPIPSISASDRPRHATNNSTLDSITSPEYDSTGNRCPQSCETIGETPVEWAAYHDLQFLQRCDSTMLLDFSLYTPLDDPSKHIRIRSCSADGDQTGSKTPGKASCDLRRVDRAETEAPVQLTWDSHKDSTYAADAVAATRQIKESINQQSIRCNEAVAFASSRQVVVGLFAGSQIQSQDKTMPILQKFISEVLENGVSENLVAQLCAAEERSSRYSLGIVVNTNGDLASVQRIVRTWSDGECVAGLGNVVDWQNLSLAIPQEVKKDVTRGGSQAHHQRSHCSTMKVVSGDSCGSLAAECGISGEKFMDHNRDPKLCSTLQIGQHVCCSAGTLPDFAPKPEADGSCAKYKIKSGDTCSALAAANSITTHDIETYNKDTWGWNGCSDLWVGNYMCLSKGSAPMPAAVSNAVCGPQVPGTPAPPPGTNLSSLNQCPLNACCDIWGQCGTTTEFCDLGTSPTGAPGTAAPGQNGCISNCGTHIVKSAPPADFKNIAYFEGFDDQRRCLQWSVSDVPLLREHYTHLHYSFATLTPAFSVDISKVAAQFQDFVNLSGIKRIISIGGWKFSTSPGTYDIFREAVRGENRATVVKNVVSFLKEFNLDGVNFDWEYPGEPDIPGIPPSSREDSHHFLLFLRDLSASMKSNAPGTSLSVAVPASYWYLKNIPIHAISNTVDYIISMTYDFHGQWDYGNSWSDPGCPGGNCLRSDVSLTETINALSMITKAGVPSNMINVGVTSYGRSFQMTTPGCAGPNCTYTGPDSGAIPGPCTNSAGYLANAEIYDIIAGNPSTKRFMDDTFSNIVVYNETQWVSYMDEQNKDARAKLYKSLHFGGTSDWALDLQPLPHEGPHGGEIYIPPSIWDSPSPQVACEPPCTLVQPPLPLTSSEVVTWSSYVTSFLSSPPSGPIQTVTSTYSLPPFTLSNVPLWPITISQGDPSTGTWVPTQSVIPPAMVTDLPPWQATIPPTPPSPKASSSGPPLVPMFFPTTQSITLQPQPTMSITFPPSLTIPTVTYSSGPPSPMTTSGCSGCGYLNCLDFGCGRGGGGGGGGGCGLFGCGGGCGIWGCHGGCGLGGCSGEGGSSEGGGPPPGPPPGGCGPSGCSGGGGGNNGGGTNNPKNPNEQCTKLQTASDCLELVTIYSTSGMTTSTTTTEVSLNGLFVMHKEYKVTDDNRELIDNLHAHSRLFCHSNDVHHHQEFCSTSNMGTILCGL